LWPFTGEMFVPAEYEDNTIEELKPSWQKKVEDVFAEATLNPPQSEKTWMQSGGKQGIHTEYMGYILTDMQYLQRAYPNSNW
jgi:ring-1,2-phenylacetyl-CoA epoxidase subunit PaaC